MNDLENDLQNDILFQIDMLLYDEFNDIIATMNDHLGDIYSYRDIEEVEKAEKEKEIKLLREAIKKLQIEYNKQTHYLKKIQTLPLYEINDEKYIKGDDFMKVWRGVVNV